MSVAYLGIGSNVGDRTANCREAIRRISEVEGITVLDASRLYETSPVGGPPQGDYINGVIKIETILRPRELLLLLKDMEKRMGRAPAGRNCPRTIDIDILLYGREVIDEKGLVVPHPRMHERTFVLEGMCQIAPDVTHPVIGRTMGELFEIAARNRD